jgi:hypothetical protein
MAGLGLPVQLSKFTIQGLVTTELRPNISIEYGISGWVNKRSPTEGTRSA